MLKSTLNHGEQGITSSHPSLYKTGPNLYRLLCCKCSVICYVNETTFQRASRAILAGADNPFFCHNCEEEPEVWLFAE
jgi:hypothetical protein